MSAASFLDAHEFPLLGGGSQGLHSPAGDDSTINRMTGAASPPPSTTCRCGCSRDAHQGSHWHCAYCPCSKYRRPHKTNAAG